MKALSESDKAAIRAYLVWRGWSEKAAERRVNEYEQAAPESHERDFKGAV